jgi:hypothetical protein
MQSVSITNYIVSSNLDQGEVYSIQHYVIEFVSGFLWVVQSPPPVKLTTTIWRYSWNIVESGVKHHQTNKQKHIFNVYYQTDVG